MSLTPLSVEALLLGAMLHNVNAMKPGYAAREEHASTSSALSLTLTIAPDETCGYLSGEVGEPITCDNGDYCTWEVKELGVIACGKAHYLQCVESSVAVDPVKYNDSIEFTFDGDDDPGFITTTISDEAPSTVSGGLPPVTVTNSRTSTGPDETSTTTSSTAPAETTHHSKSTPVGAIVGGVVGGVAVIALVVFGIIFILRRRKTNPPANQAPVNQPAISYGPPP
ncbi:hypothetical protein EDB81DRAFT_765799 [Dactylonectria macrodidyma]|uniref:Uncharacterized protein n=1 Tax=Dactylonectria macrodidyma TaxID=307937 RepID=A0A9P9DSZ2_9HYPO|nr:hypothetical protein EDB81DRAFT_765799 [Dactylonectria macrodidyma]